MHFRRLMMGFAFLACGSCGTNQGPRHHDVSDAAPALDVPTSDEISPEQFDVETYREEIVGDDISPSAALPTCIHGWNAPVIEMNLATHPLPEVSGIAASHSTPGLLWMHNDSGDGAHLHPVFMNGPASPPVLLKDINAVDFEDIARSRCPHVDADCLWIADTGNNLHDREELVVYRVVEPEVPTDPTAESGSVEALAIRFQYPDGTVDSEALLVEPDGQTFWVLEKTGGAQARLFRGDTGQAEAVQTLQDMGSFTSPGLEIQDGLGRMITGADLHPLGDRVLIRTYTGSFEHVLPESAMTDLLAAEPHLVAWGPLAEPQGEAIAYDSTGTRVHTVSEKGASSDPAFQPLHGYDCVAPPR